MMLLSNRLTLCITLFILMAFATVPVMAHPHVDDPETLDVDESIPDHNAHPVPTISTDDDTSTKTDGKDGNRIRIVHIATDDIATPNEDETVTSRTFTLLVDFGGTTVVGQSNLQALAYDTATPPAETANSVPDLNFTTILLDADGRLVAGTGITDGGILPENITTARVADSDSQILVTIELPVAALPDGAGSSTDGAATGTDDAFDEITLRIRVDATVDTATNGVFSLATRPGFNVVPGGGSVQSNLLELTLVDDIGDEPAPTPAVVRSISPGGLSGDGEVVFTITFDKDLIAGQTFRLGDITIVGGSAVDFGETDASTFTVTVRAADRTAPITVTAGGVTESSDPDEVIDVTELDINITQQRAPTADGKFVFTITSTVDLDPDLTINDFDINTGEVESLASGDLVQTAEADLPDGLAEQYMLTLTPKSGITSVLLELRAGARAYNHDGDESTDPIPTPGVEARYSPETGKPTIGDITAMNLDDSGLAATPGDIDSIDGGKITVSASDTVDGNLTSQIGNADIDVEGGTRASSVSNGMFTVIPHIGATSVKVTVKAGAVTDNAGNTNNAKSATFTVGPIFTIAKDTILVITKTTGMTHTYLSDQPRLPINAQPPTPAPNIATDIWHNMPDLEVLFNLSFTNGGTLNLTEAVGQSELGQTRDGDKNQRNAVRISEVMWASDLSKRGGLNDEEAAEQWIEISNDTGSAVKVFLFARTGRDSAINVDDVEDRIGNAYDGSIGNSSWTVPGQNGNSYTGVDFVSMRRSYVTGDNRGYVNGMSKGHWHASDREYLTLPAGNPSDPKLYHHKGSPGRPHSFSVGAPSTRERTTMVARVAQKNADGSNKTDSNGKVIYDSKPTVIINEVCNRDSANADYEWIELKNVGSNNVNLRNWMISMVTAVGTDRPLVQFPNNNNAQIGPGEVLLLLATDPRYDDDHPIAVGRNVDISQASDQVVGLGLIVDGSNRKPPKQKVVTFENGGLPDADRERNNYVLILRRHDNYEGHRSGQHGGKGVAETGEADIDKIMDIAGHHEGLSKSNYPTSNPSELNSTTLWPLWNFNNDMRPHRGHGDWNHRRHNSLDVNRVRFRQKVSTYAKNDADGGTPGNRAGTGVTHKNEDVGHYAFRDAIYTGIGYRRTARARVSYHNGTPGYDGNSVVNTGIVKTSAADASVTISEIMYSTGPNPDNPILPQWIELYNSSPTNAVDLGEGWKLVFEMLDENGDPMDSLLSLNFKDKGRVKTILPQQTVLIVAGNARQENSDSATGGDVFNDNRVFNVFRDYGGANKFGANTRYMFFNPKAFNIALVDNAGNVEDMVGNLDGDHRTSDTAEWEFPAGVAADDNRTSIIRIYDDPDGLGGAPGVARTGVNTEESNVVPIMSADSVRVDKNGDGVADRDDAGMGIDEKYSWIPAVNTEREFKITIKSTWFGIEDDYGTPNNRPGMVLPVELSFFRPTLEDGKVTIRWTTESELDNAGFNILRSETRSGEYTQVNAEMIQGAGTTGERTTYSWVDATAKPGVVYYYQIEDVSFAGEHQALAITKLKGLISAENKLTTTWSELKEASQ